MRSMAAWNWDSVDWGAAHTPGCSAGERTRATVHRLTTLVDDFFRHYTMLANTGWLPAFHHGGCPRTRLHETEQSSRNSFPGVRVCAMALDSAHVIQPAGRVAETGTITGHISGHPGAGHVTLLGPGKGGGIRVPAGTGAAPPPILFALFVGGRVTTRAAYAPPSPAPQLHAPTIWLRPPQIRRRWLLTPVCARFGLTKRCYFTDVFRL